MTLSCRLSDFGGGTVIRLVLPAKTFVEISMVDTARLYLR